MQGRGMVSYCHQGGGEGLVPASLLSPIPLSWFKNEEEEKKEEEEDADEEDVVFSTGNTSTHQLFNQSINQSVISSINTLI